MKKYLLTLYHLTKLRVEMLLVLAQHCSSCVLCVALADDVERGKHGVSASAVAFRLFVGACLQCACDWTESVIYVCQLYSGKWRSWGVVVGQKKKSHAAEG